MMEDYPYMVQFVENIKARPFYCVAHDWCRWNIKDFRAMYLGPKTEFYFKNADDALMFKLTWGGA